jgi:hypothetical protein
MLDRWEGPVLKYIGVFGLHEPDVAAYYCCRVVDARLRLAFAQGDVRSTPATEFFPTTWADAGRSRRSPEATFFFAVTLALNV